MQTVVEFGKELRSFRQKFLSVHHIFSLLRTNRSILLSVETGVGKSHLILEIIKSKKVRGDYIPLYFSDTHNLSNEIISELESENFTVVKLKGRPSALCGIHDSEWKKMEKQGTTTLAKNRICIVCIHYQSGSCTWPHHPSKISLETADAIIGVADHLLTRGDLIKKVEIAKKGLLPLVIVDEDKIIRSDTKKIVLIATILLFINTIKCVLRSKNALLNKSEKSALDFWLEFSIKTINTKTVESCETPLMTKNLILLIQECGLELDRHFRFPLYDLMNMTRTPFNSKWYNPEIDAFEYIYYPNIYEHHLIICAANLDIEIVSARLNRNDFINAAPKLNLIHPGTRVYNLTSNTGSAYNFGRYDKNKRLLFYFASLISDRILLGKKVLLVSKKIFIPTIINDLTHDIQSTTNMEYRVVNYSEYQSLSNKEFLIPIINYGVSGINAFQKFDTVICLNSYNIPIDLLIEKFHETIPDARDVKLKFYYKDGVKRVEVIHSMNPTLHTNIAEKLLFMLETSIVEQVVARVRFVTNPREVFLFNKSIFSFPITQKFRSLVEFRKKLNIPSIERDVNKEKIRQTIKRELLAGVSITEIKNNIGVSISTIYRVRQTLFSPSG